MPEYRIIAYYPAWVIHNQYFVTDIPADRLTHINYAFANISDEGEVVLGDEYADTQFAYPDDKAEGLRGNFNQLQKLKAKYPHLQTLISVGGWTWSGKFSDAALTPESRERFARSAVDFMLRYGFDGVDLDWEYPTGGGLSGNVERPDDKENFILMLMVLREHLDRQGAKDGRHYLLTIALGANRSQIEPLDWARIHPLLDWINVMAYDLMGNWSQRTGFHSPLYNSSENPVEGNSTDAALQALIAKGVPPEKLVMGVPFYGHGWSGVSAEHHGLHQPVGSLPAGTGDPGSFAYYDLAENYIGVYERYWHDTAQVPWLYSEATGIMISYDDPESLAIKAAYVREHGLGGMMFWEVSQDDAAHSLLNAIYEGLGGE